MALTFTITNTLSPTDESHRTQFQSTKIEISLQTQPTIKTLNPKITTIKPSNVLRTGIRLDPVASR